jgi:hypothetical protein
MGVIVGGVFGQVRNAIGDVVFSGWKGINTARRKPLSVSQPNTAAQISIKERFAAGVIIAKIILTSILKPLMDRHAVRMSAFNWWLQQNFDNLDSSGIVDYSLVVMAEGPLTPVVLGTVLATNGSPTVTVPWTDNSGTGDALNTDTAYVVVYNETQGVWAFNAGVTPRSTATLNVTLPANAATGDDLHIYINMRRANNTKVSDTVYDTITV